MVDRREAPQRNAGVLRARSSETIAEALVEGSPPAHGLQRVKDAFDIEEVVAEYNILRGCIHDLAERNGLSLQGEPFHADASLLRRVFRNRIVNAIAYTPRGEVVIGATVTEDGSREAGRAGTGSRHRQGVRRGP